MRVAQKSKYNLAKCCPGGFRKLTFKDIFNAHDFMTSQLGKCVCKQALFVPCKGPSFLRGVGDGRIWGRVGKKRLLRGGAVQKNQRTGGGSSEILREIK